jgi:hypothetical protein
MEKSGRFLKMALKLRGPASFCSQKEALPSPFSLDFRQGAAAANAPMIPRNDRRIA